MISQRVIKRFCMVRALREKSLNPFNCRWTIGKSEKSYEISHSHAFTLIELLIVIAIIAILGSATVLVLNPVEIIKQGRDGTRITDVENIQKSLNLTLFNNPSLVDSLLSTNIYLSLPSGSCPLSPPTGYAYVCNATSANINKTDGTGWIPLTLQNMASLPTDPNSNFYYAFIANPTTKTFTVTALLESEKQTKLSAAKDGGTDPGRFEKGDVSLWSGASGLVGYWPMDEGTGTTTADLSGNNKTATLFNGITWSSCKISKCLSFDGDNDYATFNTINAGTVYSLSVWVYPGAATSTDWFNILSNKGQPQFGMPDGTLNAQLYGRVTGSVLTRNDWSNVIVVRNGDNHKIYINGVLINQANVAVGADYYWVIGAFVFDSADITAREPWNGLLDDIRIYNRPLPTDEISAIYNANK